MTTTTTTVFGGSVPVTELAHCVASYQATVATLGRLDDDAAAGPSLLPGWTRGHVVTHLARHADSHVRMLRGLVAGQSIPQYSGGERSRNREIEKGAGRSAARLVDDFRTANEALFSVWEQLPDDLWDRPVDAFGGRRPANQLAWARWRELEIHHVDLDLGFSRRQWPLAFVITAIQRTLHSAPLRTADGSLPPGRWALEATDRPGRWVLVSEVGDGDGEPEISVLDGDEAASATADSTVRGPVSDLLAWLVGRLPFEAGELEVQGDPEPITRLPLLFPYP